MNKKQKRILVGFIPFAAYLVGFSALIINELKKRP